MVIIDVAASKIFGFYTNMTIYECSFQKVGHDQKCVSNQAWSPCASMKLAVLASNEACYIHNTGLTLNGILAKMADILACLLDLSLVE